MQHALFSDEVSKPFRDVYVRSFGLALESNGVLISLTKKQRYLNWCQCLNFPILNFSLSICAWITDRAYTNGPFCAKDY